MWRSKEVIGYSVRISNERKNIIIESRVWSSSIGQRATIQWHHFFTESKGRGTSTSNFSKRRGYQKINRNKGLKGKTISKLCWKKERIIKIKLKNPEWESQMHELDWQTQGVKGRIIGEHKTKR